MFTIKICGITNSLDALACKKFGADAIGLNFYQQSLRSVSIEHAQQISNELGDSMCKVGVFVTQSADQISEIMEKCGLDVVQLHGSQGPETMGDLDHANTPVIRALAWKSLEQVQCDAEIWVAAGVRGILLDSVRGKQFGGTGRPIDWPSVSQLSLEVPIVLAGGLTPANIEEAISISGIGRVDTASGVESFPGKKQHELLKTFIERARRYGAAQK